jgi:hypothetical protein
MKRLIRKAKNTYLLHGTNLYSLDSILANGIKAEQYSQSAHSDTNQKLVYLTCFASTAEDYAYMKWESDGSSPKDCLVILEIVLDDSLLVPDNDDCPECETWQESYNAVGQVGVVGDVGVEKIKNIKLMSPYNNYPLNYCSTSQYLSSKEEIISKIFESSKKHEQTLKEMSGVPEELIDVFYQLKKIDRIVFLISVIDYDKQNNNIEETLYNQKIKEFTKNINDICSIINQYIENFNQQSDKTISPMVVEEQSNMENGAFFTIKLGEISVNTEYGSVSKEFYDWVLNFFKKTSNIM